MEQHRNLFSGLFLAETQKPLKRFRIIAPPTTSLKQGVNEISNEWGNNQHVSESLNAAERRHLVFTISNLSNPSLAIAQL